MLFFDVSSLGTGLCEVYRLVEMIRRGPKGLGWTISDVIVETYFDDVVQCFTLAEQGSRSWLRIYGRVVCASWSRV